MSEENVEIVRRAFEAWNQGRAESAKRFWAEDYEYHDPPDFPDPRVVRGREAVAAHLKDQTSVLGDLMVTIVDVRARDETVVVRSEGTAHGAESGVEVPAEATQVFEVAAGRLQRARMFLTWEEALEAALLSHPALDHGLLRQPSGFEGFGMALVCPTPDAKTVAVAGEPTIA